MNILIITYYWPPAGGSGVQRWLYMANHLADIPGNNVTVFVDDSVYKGIVCRKFSIETSYNEED